jgi:hypothetical protein
MTPSEAREVLSLWTAEPSSFGQFDMGRLDEAIRTVLAELARYGERMDRLKDELLDRNGRVLMLQAEVERLRRLCASAPSARRGNRWTHSGT